MSEPVTPPSGPDEWGIVSRYLDAHDVEQTVAPDSIEGLRTLIGRPPADLEQTAPIVARPGDDLGLGSVDIACEDGVDRAVGGALPDDFPLGYHRLPDGRRLIVSPGRCSLPTAGRAWGWTLQLYAARSRRSWGIGDLADLRALTEWSASLGAGFVLINPLHAVAPTFPQEASPYLPTSRRFRNPVYIAVDEAPGADQVDLAPHVERGAELNAMPRIDRDQVWRLKREALLAVHAARVDRDAFEQWRDAGGDDLRDFARWMTLALDHGADWRTWPEPLRDPAGDAVAAHADEHADEVDFQLWLQWVLDQQLNHASAPVKVLQDLPIGVDGGGADAWVWQDVLAEGASVGAPPDLLSSQGQNWGSPPLVPWRLRAAEYEPFIASIRATMAGAGGLRIDHVMGLFRLWWVPPGQTAVAGAYVRYPSDDLLDIVALESHRHDAVVVGEDLGTVEEGVRETLEERALLSYRLLWFEDDGPAAWPESAMAAITTHDLPTLAGLWSGDDLADQLAHTDDDRDLLEQQRQLLLKPLRDQTSLDDDSTVEDALVEAHRLLGEAPSLLISATLDDAVAARMRPNMPGTQQRDNWCIPLPVPIDELSSHSLANRLAKVLNSAINRRG